MKKILCMILALALVLGLCACADTGSNADTTGSAADTTADGGNASAGGFKAGFGEGNITPIGDPLPMQGYGDSLERLHTGILSYIYAHAVAFQDETGNTAIIITVDNASLSESTDKMLAQRIEEKTGVPSENIFISANHLHSTPCYGSESAAASEYANVLYGGIVESGVKAYENLAPATMEIAKADAPNMCFVRNYVCNDGSFAGDNYGTTASGIKDHESVADTQLQLIKLVREGQTTADGKEAKNIVIANFQGHPHRDVWGNSTNYTAVFANVPGVFRETLAEEWDCHVAYFTGASGNMNMNSRISEENIYKTYKEHGQALAKVAMNAEFKSVATGAVKTLTVKKTYNANKADVDTMLADAERVQAARNNGPLDDAKKLSDELGFHSVFHASAVVSRAAADPTKDITLSVLSIGDVSFCATPYEMFDTNGKEVKDGTVGNDAYATEDQQSNPFEMTFLMYLCNGSNGYIPSRIGCANGGYATDITYYEYGTGEKLTTEYLKMLNEIHE